MYFYTAIFKQNLSICKFLIDKICEPWDILYMVFLMRGDSKKIDARRTFDSCMHKPICSTDRHPVFAIFENQIFLPNNLRVTSPMNRNDAWVQRAKENSYCFTLSKENLLAHCVFVTGSVALIVRPMNSKSKGELAVDGDLPRSRCENFPTNSRRTSRIFNSLKFLSSIF